MVGARAVGCGAGRRPAGPKSRGRGRFAGQAARNARQASLGGLPRMQGRSPRRPGEADRVGGCPAVRLPRVLAMRQGMLPGSGTIRPKPRPAGEACASFFCGPTAWGKGLAGPLPAPDGSCPGPHVQKPRGPSGRRARRHAGPQAVRYIRQAAVISPMPNSTAMMPIQIAPIIAENTGKITSTRPKRI